MDVFGYIQVAYILKLHMVLVALMLISLLFFKLGMIFYLLLPYRQITIFSYLFCYTLLLFYDSLMNIKLRAYQENYN